MGVTFCKNCSVILLILLCLFLCCERNKLPLNSTNMNFGKINGMVLDQTSLLPLNGAIVLAKKNGKIAISGADGIFTFDSLALGVDTLRVSAEGYNGKNLPINVSPGRQNVELALLCDPSVYMDTSRAYFYYYYGPIYLTLATDLIGARFDTLLTDEEVDAIAAKYEMIKIGVLARELYFFKMGNEKRAEEFYTFYGQQTNCGFGNQNGVLFAAPVFWSRPSVDSSLLFLTDEFIGKIDTTVMPLAKIEQINRQHHILMFNFSHYHLFQVTKKSDLNALDMANLYQDSAYTIFSSPNFLELRTNYP